MLCRIAKWLEKKNLDLDFFCTVELGTNGLKTCFDPLMDIV